MAFTHDSNSPTVPVLVNSRAVPLSAQALTAGLCHLRHATGAQVSLRDYTEAIAVVLEGLEKAGVLEFPSR